jgi:hypothetical protein
MVSTKIRKAVCTVTELAKTLGLSRARFYQLQKSGVFPPPVYGVYTKRPYYHREAQEQCLHIRQTGIGYNGRPIVFNVSRKNKSRASPKDSDHRYRVATNTLKEMGLSQVTQGDIKKAVKAVYPEGWPPDLDDGVIIRNLFKYLQPRR